MAFMMFQLEKSKKKKQEANTVRQTKAELAKFDMAQAIYGGVGVGGGRRGGAAVHDEEGGEEQAPPTIQPQKDKSKEEEEVADYPTTALQLHSRSDIPINAMLSMDPPSPSQPGGPIDIDDPDGDIQGLATAAEEATGEGASQGAVSDEATSTITSTSRRGGRGRQRYGFVPSKRTPPTRRSAESIDVGGATNAETLAESVDVRDAPKAEILAESIAVMNAPRAEILAESIGVGNNAHKDEYLRARFHTDDDGDSTRTSTTSYIVAPSANTNASATNHSSVRTVDTSGKEKDKELQALKKEIQRLQRLAQKPDIVCVKEHDNSVVSCMTDDRREGDNHALLDRYYISSTGPRRRVVRSKGGWYVCFSIGIGCERRLGTTGWSFLTFVFTTFMYPVFYSGMPVQNCLNSQGYSRRSRSL
jgi:hypothetical protein